MWPPRTAKLRQRYLEITQFEEAARSQGYSKIAGVDEAGRGRLAGPVVAAACILPSNFFLPGIDDSKRLSAKQREEICHILTANQDVLYGIGIISAFIIDQINILQASLKAMVAAIQAVSSPPDFILVDGPQAPSVPLPCQPIVQGDTLSQSIMAAAIIAKVKSDQLMVDYGKVYPNYGFASHKGYATPEHLRALAEFGECPIHRKTFAPIKDLLRN